MAALSPGVQQVVEDGFDAADDWIVEQVEADDIVITADIPLAGRCLKKGAAVLGSTGKPFTEDMIGDALATRELLSELREAGTATGGQDYSLVSNQVPLTGTVTIPAEGTRSRCSTSTPSSRATVWAVPSYGATGWPRSSNVGG